MMTDPIADELTRVRNALAIRQKHVDVPHSRMKQGVAEALKREGYIDGLQVIDTKPFRTLRIRLKYGADREEVIHHLQRVSRPGRRIFSGVADMKPVHEGLGVFIVSTSKGILSDRECKQRNLGGEILAEVW